MDNHPKAARPALMLIAGLLCCSGAGGCAALSNPFAEAVPVRQLPPDLLAPSKDQAQTIPLTLLRQPPPCAYRLGPGDVLGVYVEGFLGDRNIPLPLHVAPQVQVRDQRRLPAATGYPVQVREDGTIALPLLAPLRVQGLTLAEAQQAIRQVYIQNKLVKPENDRTLVTLLNPRQYQVLVLRQEGGSFTVGPEGLISGTKRGTGHLVDLLAYENDVLHALTLTGGLPGLDAINEVIIERGCFYDDHDRLAVKQQLESLPACGPQQIARLGRQTIRIPLRCPPGDKLPFGPQDVVLQTGDVVFIEARDDQLYYTGGLMPAGEHVLPRDHNLDVVQAVLQVHGPLYNGAFATNNLSGNLLLPGIGNPSPSLLVVLRQTPDGRQVPIQVDLSRAMLDARERILVQAGDVLILQETPGEAVARFVTQTFLNFDFSWQAIRGRYTTGVVNVSAPDRLPGRLEQVTIVPR